jgi:hypothetical protein
MIIESQNHSARDVAPGELYTLSFPNDRIQLRRQGTPGLNGNISVRIAAYATEAQGRQRQQGPIPWIQGKPAHAQALVNCRMTPFCNSCEKTHASLRK